MTLTHTVSNWHAKLASGALLAVLAFAAGCTVASDVENQIGVTEAEMEVVAAATVHDATVDALASAQTTVLRFPVTRCGPADPAVDVRRFEHPVSWEIHAGLSRFKAYPELGFELDLASGYSVDESGTVFVFTLRPGLKFSDGSAILASDFVWSWNRAVRKARHGSSANVVFEPILGFEDAVGSWDAEMEGLAAVDDRTLEVRLTRAVPDFPLMMASPVAAVLKADNALLWDDTWSNTGTYMETRFEQSNLPVGAGPFRLSAYNPLQNGCIIEANPHYHGGGGPQVERVELIQVDLAQVAGAFESGQIDVATGLHVGFSDVDEAVLIRTGTPEYLLFNAAEAPLDSVEFRRALVHATPVFAVGDDTHDAQRLLPSELARNTMLEGRLIYDEDLARQELAACSCFDGGQIRSLAFQTDVIATGLTPLRRMFQGWDEALGVRVNESVARPAVISSGAQSGSLDMMLFRSPLAYPSPVALLGRLLAAIPGGDRSDIVSELRQLARHAAAEQDSNRQTELALDLEQRILDNGLAMPVLSLGTEYARIKPWVHGLGPTWPGASFFRDVRVVDRP